ncbi:glycosyl transferase family 2 [Flavobacterium cyanobacteriorum]|uniref:Glycosyl transferase family 2 n=1 Tax=Flavobacterium cyanobacteriorum TaxID=2022802 RepID=A0A255Z799_9FLAO|nr:glycosyltransferase [Flavobacterium cyanobacteriorum]OYQ37316.1 glycosyl transferase family 2 [Flavobacterium cyanobacteriorum]
MYFSLIIPVFNRPDEIEELLRSLTLQTYTQPYEIVIVEDGSSVPCRHITDSYSHVLSISYFFKENSGPGDSRNFGMSMAKGNYFIILDSDCILPGDYLSNVSDALERDYVDCFGGPDAAHYSFTTIQKAINFTMTSVFTTGGIRGKSEKVEKFQPRSFNMGLSRAAFEASGGFGNIHPGEDPDLSIRLWKLGFRTKLLLNAYVFHKRRIDWRKFYRQVNKFGKARPILDVWHPGYKKITYLFPSLFILGFAAALIILLINIKLPFYLYILYMVLLFCMSWLENRSPLIGIYSVIAAAIQFYGYGIGYLQSYIKVQVLKMAPEKAFPELFFKR